jgi:hypothetical protein
MMSIILGEFKLTHSYDSIFSHIKSFYDLDNRTPIIQTLSKLYIIERTSRDYTFIQKLLPSACSESNISKIKQMSSLFDLLHYVDYEYSTTKNSELRIEIYEHDIVQISFGNILYFSLSKSYKKILEDIVFASKKSLTIDTFIEDDIFEKIYFDNLEHLSKYVEPNMTFKLFNEIDNKTLDEVRIENLGNTDISYHSMAKAECLFHDFEREHDDFFQPLKNIFSNNLLRQVKSIEALLRFESDLKYGKLAYELEFNYSISKHKFRTPTNLYAILFHYDYELDLRTTIYFKFKNNEIRYVELDLGFNETIDVSGYEAIYAYLHNRIKELIVSKLGITAEDITNRSMLLYKMLSI